MLNVQDLHRGTARRYFAVVSKSCKAREGPGLDSYDRSLPDTSPLLRGSGSNTWRYDPEARQEDPEVLHRGVCGCGLNAFSGAMIE